MRILIISNIFPPGFMGGYELGAAEISDGLSRRGHQVDVLTSNFLVDDTGGDVGRDGHPKVYRSLDCTEPSLSPIEADERRWFGGFAVPRNLRELAGKLRTGQPDAVLCFNLAGVGAPSILRLLTACGLRPVIYMMDLVFSTMLADKNRRRGFERVFSTADWPDSTRFLFMSQTLRDEVEEGLGRMVRHSQIVPGWFSSAAATPIVSRAGEQTRFVFASRIAPHKGVRLVLDACRLLLDKGQGNFNVDIYGAGEAGETIQRITAMHLRDHVRYRGAPQKSELMPLLSDYDALLFPSWHREPFGFIVAEAAGAGCIPIMSFGVGAAEWFLDGIDCEKTERDAESLCAAMLKVAGMTLEARIEMRCRAQATAQRYLSFEGALDRIEATLEEAAGGPTRNPRAMEAALAVLTEIWRVRPYG